MARTRKGTVVETVIFGGLAIFLIKAVGDIAHTGRVTIPGTDTTLLNLSNAVPVGAGRVPVTSAGTPAAPVVAPVSMGATTPGEMVPTPPPPGRSDAPSAFPPKPEDVRLRASAVDLAQYGAPGYGWNGWHVFHIETARRTNNADGVIGVAYSDTEAAALAAQAGVTI